MKIIFLSLILLNGCSFIDIDKCLDAGGSWDKDQKQCFYEAN